MSNIYFDSKAYDANKVFLHVESPTATLGDKTVASLDANGDQFISFEEAGNDDVKFQLLAGQGSVKSYKGMTLDEAKVQLAKQEDAAKRTLEIEKNLCKFSHKGC